MTPGADRPPRTPAPTDGRIRRLSPKQVWSASRADRRVNVWEGAVRSGKTVGSFFPWIEHVQRAPYGDLFMIGKSSAALERNVLRPLQDILGSHVFEFSAAAGEAHLGGRRIELVSAYDEASYKKIRGSTCAGFYGDELTLWPHSFFAELLHRMSPAGARGYGTTNPDSPFHWLLTEYLSRAAALGWRRFRFRLEDNPFLTPEYVHALKVENRGLFFKRLILGLWVLAAGAVYDMFDEDRNVHPLPATGTFPHYGVGVDYGSANPTVFGLYGWGRPDGRVWLVDLYYHDPRKTGRSKTDEAYARDFLAFTAGVSLSRVVVDPSALSFILALRDKGVAAEPADNNVAEGIRLVGSALDGDRFRIARTPATRPIVEEFGGYVWDEKAQKRGIDRPLKAHGVADHALDQLRYFLRTVFHSFDRIGAADSYAVGI